MRKLFVILAIVMAGASVMAKDVLYLKNGSVIKGEILEFNMGGNVKIQTSDGSLFVYGTDQVEKLEKESDSSQANSKIGQKTEVVKKQEGSSQAELIFTNEENNKFKKNFRHKGYRGFVDLGGFVGLDDAFDSYSAFMFSTSHGYQFCPWIFLGGGFGVNSYSYSGNAIFTDELGSQFGWSPYKGTGTFVPFYIDVRVSPIGNKRVTPFFGMKLGYSVSTMEKPNGGNVGGFYHQYSAGISVAILSNLGWYLSLGFSGQKINSSGLLVEINAEFATHAILKGHTLNGLAIQTGFDF
ncbi:MAG: hypothetical protein E7073_03555 [Bacteroidales bacterium]|nr:hypothetical protein [Bacteroidales bacterium]